MYYFDVQLVFILWCKYEIIKTKICTHILDKNIFINNQWRQKYVDYGNIKEICISFRFQLMNWWNDYLIRVTRIIGWISIGVER